MQNKIQKWKPALLTGNTTLTNANDSGNIVINLDSATYFKCSQFMLYAFVNGSPGTIAYCLMTSLIIGGQEAKKIIVGSGLHSSVFSRSASVPLLWLPMNVDIESNSQIQINLTTETAGAKIFALFSGMQKI